MEWCPTGDMIADFFTKPLQGSLFCHMRDAVMGTTPRSQIRKDTKVGESLMQRK